MARPRQDLRIAFCDGRAAKYACEHWHYSGTVPSGAVVRFGVWEEQFIGAVIYSKGSGRTTFRATWYGLERWDACELARVALTNHEAPVTQIVAGTLRKLKEANPGIRLVISYADPHEGHHGGIYQAGNWIYVGVSAPTPVYRLNGKWRHHRSVTAGKQRAIMNDEVPQWDEWFHSLAKRERPGKHVYLYPFDRQIRRAVLADQLPYPSPAEQVSK